MQPIPMKCPHCSHPMEYWTVEDYIFCSKCGGKITVEPCTEKLDMDMTEEELELQKLGVKQRIAVEEEIVEGIELIEINKPEGSDNFCSDCVHHEIYYEECSNGKIYNDGCSCKYV